MASGKSFLYLAGRLSLDFAQAHDTGSGVRDPVADVGSLADWLAGSSLALLVDAISPDELEQARRLRTALFRAAHSAAGGRPIASESQTIINRCASEPDLVPQIEDGLTLWRDQPSATEALSSIARDAIDLLGSNQRRRIRICKNPDCGLFFVDLSRPGKRVWCSMDRCGNLAKTRGYRGRKKAK